MKGHRSTIALLLLATALGLWLWLDRNQVTEGERKRRENNVFSAWRRDDLSVIEIAHDGETIVLARDARSDGAWRMRAPREERVDQAAAERLLTTLEFATVVRKVGDDPSLGLESPRATGSVTMGTLVMRFALGASSPRPEGSSYFRVDGGPPFVVSKELTETLLASSDTYRDRTVVPYLSIELARFEVKHPSGGFVVERSDERSFKVQGPGVLASRAALDKVWGALAEMRAEAFPKDADADRLTEKPELTILMTSKDAGKPLGEILVGGPCPGHPNDVVVLRRQPTRGLACAPKGAMDALVATTPESLVDRRPFSFRHDEIEELVLERLDGAAVPAGGAGATAPRKIELARRGTGFHQREPVDRELTSEEAEAASDLVTQIEHGAAIEVRPGTVPFVAAARARVRSGDHEEVVEIGALPGGAPGPASATETTDAASASPAVQVRRVRDDARLVVSPAVARRLLPRATAVRSRALLTETRRVKRVVLRCGTPQELVDQGSGLKLVDPPGYETDGSITQLVDGLLRGKVVAWVADGDDGSFGLGYARASRPGEAPPREPAADSACRVVLAFEDGNAPVTVRFGAEGEGGIYGAVDGRPEVFVAPLPLHELVKRIYVSRASLREEPSRIESVKVVVKGKAVTTQSQETLRLAAGGIFADRVVSLGSTDVGPAEVEILMTLGEAGGAKRVSCGPIVGAWRRCSTPGVKAIFDVHPSTLGGLLDPADAAAPFASGAASHEGPR